MRLLACVVTFVAIATSVGLDGSAQAQATPIRRIGYLTLDAPAIHAPFAAAFRDGLRENGFIDGKNIAIEWRYADYSTTALPTLASELVAEKLEVLIADGTQSALAAKAATHTVPIVTAASGDLVRAGLVASLANPGGNLTGFTLLSPGLVGKRLALLKEVAPRTRRVGVLVNPDNPSSTFQLSEAQVAAPKLGLKLRSASIRRPEDIEGTIRSLVGHVDAILVTDDVMMDSHRARIGTQALRSRLPSICSYPMPDDNVCLMWYGPDLLTIFRRSANYVARILRGAKPADLPVEQPTRFSLIINAKTAEALGITIPQSLVLTADSVIR